MQKVYRVVIPLVAKQSLNDIIAFIKNDSPASATRVKKRLIEIAKSLEIFPERFSREPYLSEKEGNYRSVTQWHFKIVYKVLKDEVVILRFIHTSIDPDHFKKIE